VLQLLRSILEREELAPLLQENTFFSEKLSEQINTINKSVLKAIDQKKSSEPKPAENETVVESPDKKEESMLAKETSDAVDVVGSWVKEKRRKVVVSEEIIREIPKPTLFDNYKEKLEKLQFEERAMSIDGTYNHHFVTNITQSQTNGNTEKFKRLIQEIGSMSNSLPLNPESSIFLRVDSSRIDVMKVLITGPTGTPYANGCFQFDIYCPPNYPNNPPLCNLQTTGGGSVRFNPNLYNCGKVCLSLLGTWNGGKNEKWDARVSTLLQLLISIQSLIMVHEPYFNEPSYESSIGTPEGTQASINYNLVIRRGTMKWAMLEQIKQPSPGFEDVIKLHFKLKKDEILKQCGEWLADDSSCQAIFDELKLVLQKLESKE